MRRVILSMTLAAAIVLTGSTFAGAQDASPEQVQVENPWAQLQAYAAAWAEWAQKAAAVQPEISSDPANAATVSPPEAAPAQTSSESPVRRAAAVALDDPRDVGGALDVKRATANTSGTQVVYEAEMWDDFTPQQVDALDWAYDFTGGGKVEACLDVRWDGEKLDGELFGNGCSGRALARSDVKKSGRTIRVAIESSALREAGLVGSSYHYRVVTNQRMNGQLGTDKAPDEGTGPALHELGAAAPAASVATAAPTAGAAGSSTAAGASPASSAAAAAATAKPSAQTAARSTTASPAPARKPLAGTGGPIQTVFMLGLLLMALGVTSVGVGKLAAIQSDPFAVPAVMAVRRGIIDIPIPARAESALKFVQRVVVVLPTLGDRMVKLAAAIERAIDDGRPLRTALAQAL